MDNCRGYSGDCAKHLVRIYDDPREQVQHQRRKFRGREQESRNRIYLRPQNQLP